MKFLVTKYIHTLVNVGNELWVLSTIKCPDFCHIKYVFLIVARNRAIYVENLVAHLE